MITRKEGNQPHHSEYTVRHCSGRLPERKGLSEKWNPFQSLTFFGDLLLLFAIWGFVFINNILAQRCKMAICKRRV